MKSSMMEFISSVLHSYPKETVRKDTFRHILLKVVEVRAMGILLHMSLFPYFGFLTENKIIGHTYILVISLVILEYGITRVTPLSFVTLSSSRSSPISKLSHHCSV